MKELIRRTRSILNNQQGFAIVLLFLILLPVIIFTCISAIEMTNVVQTGDMDLQEGIVLATKAAAERVNMPLHAQGIFQISPDEAESSYREVLARNIGLDENILVPTTKAYSSAPKYCLLVYNGTSTGATANKKFNFNGTNTTSTVFSQTGFPKTFIINGLDIVVGSGKGSITLTEPGVIAVVEIDQKDLLAENDCTLTRWAAARIKTIK